MISIDAELMKQVASGDILATRKVVTQHLPYVINIANRIVRDLDEAEDISQESFLKLWKQAPQWQPKAKISTWLYTVTRNAALDRIKKKKPILNTTLLETTHFQPDNSDESTSSTPQSSQEKQDLLQEVLSRLSEKYRLVLTAFYFDNLKIHEAAQTFSMSEDAYESLLRRARQKLKTLMKEDRNQNKILPS